MAKVKKERLIAVNPSGSREGSTVALIHDVVRQIPRGRVTTYGAIAAVLNLPNPRMVGHAMRSGDARLPAQRVINSSGHITGDHAEQRKKLLEKEGVEVRGTRVVGFRELFWDPAAEL